MHWAVDVNILRPLVPRELELDTFQGQAYVGLVPFAMQDIRLTGWPSFTALDFFETNLRTYVHLNGQSPGVYFFSLDASSLLAVLVARATFKLPYYYARMAMIKKSQHVRYELQRLSPSRAHLQLSYEIGTALPRSEPGTLQHFLLERYLLHVVSGGRVWTGQVHHEPYQAFAARLDAFEETILKAHGAEQKVWPEILHYSPGVDVEVFALHGSAGVSPA